MEKILVFFTLFQKGEVIANPEVWKKRQVNVTMITGFLVALMNLLMVLGIVTIPLNIDAINTIAGGLLALYNIVMTYITTDKIGVDKNNSVDKNNGVDKNNSDVPPDEGNI